MSSNKHGEFVINSESGKQLVIQSKVISRTVLSAIGALDAQIESPRKRAMTIKDQANSLIKFVATETELTPEQVYQKYLGSKPAYLELVKFVNDNNLSIEDIEQFAQQSNLADRADIARIQIIQLIADRSKMDADSLALLDSPAEPAKVDVADKPKNKKVVEPPYNFWNEADITEVRECADYFRSLCRARAF